MLMVTKSLQILIVIFSMVCNICATKPAILYHGNAESDLVKITPYKYANGSMWIYASSSKAMSALYATNWNFLDFKVIGYNVGHPMLIIERYPGAFNIFKKSSGSIYKLSSDRFQQMKDKTICYQSHEDELPLGEIKLPNIWLYMKELESEGQVKLYNYEDWVNYVENDQKILIQKAVNHYLNTDDKKEFYQEFITKHPALKEAFDIRLKDEGYKDLTFN